MTSALSVSAVPGWLLELLPEGEESSVAAVGDTELRELLDRLTLEQPDPTAVAGLQTVCNQLRTLAPGERYPEMRQAVFEVLEQAARGLVDARRALREVADAYAATLDEAEVRRRRPRRQVTEVARWWAGKHAAELPDPQPGTADEPPRTEADGAPTGGQAQGPAGGTDADGWPEPLPLEQAPTPAPLELLPPLLQQVVGTVSQHTQTPPELALVAALAAVSAATAGKVQVDVGWVEPLALYVLAVADPGDRKSPVLKHTASKPLRTAMRLVAEAMRPEIDLAGARRQVAEGRLERVKKELTKPGAEAGEDDLAEALDALRDLPDAPRGPDYLLTDATPEALELVMAQEHGCAAAFAAEGTIISTLAGRYADGKPSVGNLNSAWSGEEFDVRRVKDGHRRMVPAPHASMCLLVQPVVAELMGTTALFEETGFLSRWVYTRPRSWVGHRSEHVIPLDEVTLDTWERLLHRLLADAWPRDEPRLLVTDEPAREVVRRLTKHVEQLLADPEGALSAPERLWLAKSVGQAVRVAGILALIEDPDTDAVTVAQLERAETLWAWLFGEARAAFGRTADGSGIDIPVAGRILEWLRRRGSQEGFTSRTIQQFGPRRLRRMHPEELELVLDALVAWGWLRKEPAKPVALVRGGRPPRDAYRPHPQLGRWLQNPATKPIVAATEAGFVATPDRAGSPSPQNNPDEAPDHGRFRSNVATPYRDLQPRREGEEDAFSETPLETGYIATKPDSGVRQDRSDTPESGGAPARPRTMPPDAADTSTSPAPSASPVDAEPSARTAVTAAVDEDLVEILGLPADGRCPQCQTPLTWDQAYYTCPRCCTPPDDRPDADQREDQTR